jgi:hypothetical protein
MIASSAINNTYVNRRLAFEVQIPAGQASTDIVDLGGGTAVALTVLTGVSGAQLRVEGGIHPDHVYPLRNAGGTLAYVDIAAIPVTIVSGDAIDGLIGIRYLRLTSCDAAGAPVNQAVTGRLILSIQAVN